MDLRLFESILSSSQCFTKKKDKSELRLSAKERWIRLRQAGFAKEELQESKEANPHQRTSDMRARVLQERENRLLAAQQLQPVTLAAIRENSTPAKFAGVSA